MANGTTPYRQINNLPDAVISRRPLSDRVRGGGPPEDLDEAGSSRLIGMIEEICRKEQGTWQATTERSQKVHSTGYDEAARGGARRKLFDPSASGKAYFPGIAYTDIATYLAVLPPGAVVASIAYLVKEPLTPWLKNRGGRHAKLQVGNIEIEFSGDAHSLEKALQTLSELPGWATAPRVKAKASPPASEVSSKRKSRSKGGLTTKKAETLKKPKRGTPP